MQWRRSIKYEKLATVVHSVYDAALGHSPFLFCWGGQRNECTKIHNSLFFAIKPFVWWRSRCRRRLGFLKLPKCNKRDGDAEDNVDWKTTYILHRNYTSISLYQFRWRVFVQNILSFTCKGGAHFKWAPPLREKKYRYCTIVVHVLQTTPNLVISHSCFGEDG